MANSTSSTNSLGNAQITNYNGYLQMYGLGSGLDIQSILNAEISVMQAQQTPYQNQITTLSSQKNTWSSLKSALSSFETTINSLRDISTASKNVTFSDSSALSATATSTALSASYTISVQSIATKQRLMSDNVGTGALGYDGTVQLNGKDLAITSGMTIKDVANTINKGTYGVDAVVLNDTLVLTAKNTGTANAIKFDDSAFWQNIGVLSGTGVKNQIQAPTDASYMINGVQMTSSSNTVTNIDGVNLTLSKPTTGDVEMTVSDQTDAAESALNELVTSYNQIISGINNLTAKGESMQGETALNTLKRRMGELLTTKTNSSLYLFNVGIQMDKNAKDGTIVFDKTAFEKQIKNNPSEVLNLISGKNSFSSMLSSLVDTYTNEASGTIIGKMKGIDNRVAAINKTLDQMNTEFDMQKKGLLDKYSQLESTLGSLNQQSQYISSQLSAWNNSNN